MNSQTVTRYLNDLVGEIGNIQQSIHNTQRTIEMIRHIVSFIESQETQISQLNEALTLARTHNRDLTNLNESLQNQMASLRASFQSQISTLVNEKERLEREIEELKIKNAEFIEKISNRITEKFIGTLEPKIHDLLQRNLTNLSQEIQNKLNEAARYLRNELTKWENMIGTLNSSLDARFERNQSQIKDLLRDYSRETRTMLEKLNETLEKNRQEISENLFNRLTRYIGTNVKDVVLRNINRRFDDLNAYNDSFRQTMMRKLESDRNTILAEINNSSNLIIYEFRNARACNCGQTSNNGPVIRSTCPVSLLVLFIKRRFNYLKWVVLILIISVFIYLFIGACDNCFQLGLLS